MRSRTILLSLAVLLSAVPLLAAFNPGDVLLENRTDRSSFELWEHFGGPYALLVGFPLIYKDVPFTGPGHFLAPSPGQIVFHSNQTVSVWDGVDRLYTEAGDGYTDIFHDDAELGEIAPAGGGNFLVPEVATDGSRAPQLIEFNPGGRVASFPFSGATHIELLSDRCTLLFAEDNRIGRFNICSGQEESDFAVLPFGGSAGAIRQAGNGSIFAANGSAIRELTADGSLLRTIEAPGVTHLALSTDGKALWAAGVDNGQAWLRQYPLAGDTPASSVPLGNPEMQSIVIPLNVDDLVVVGEWRAATAGRQRIRLIRR
jgi:hypothetical protein